MKKTWYLAFLLLIIASMVLLRCATIPKGTDLRDSLRSTAEAYWKLRMEDRYENTYKIEDKEGLLSFEEYLPNARAIKKFTILSNTVKDVRIEGDNGVVDVELRFRLPMVSKPFTQVIKDKWIYKGRKWRHRF